MGKIKQAENSGLSGYIFSPNLILFLGDNSFEEMYILFEFIFYLIFTENLKIVLLNIYKL